MSYLSLSSTNPQFSYIVSKNPETIKSTKTPFKRALRQGTVFGWFSPDAQTFSLYFRDNEVENSYGNGSFEYLDTSRYEDPRIILGMITESLKSAITNQYELDGPGFASSITFTSRVSSFLRSRAPFNKFTYEPITPDGNYFNITIKGETAYEVLNLAQALCILTCVGNESLYLPLDEAGVVKYLKSFAKIEAPYPVWALFISRAITSIELFRKVQEYFTLPGVKFKYGNTQLQRHKAIVEAFDDSKAETLIDIGCGEMYHTRRLSEKYTQVIAVEKDTDLNAINERKVERNKLNVLPLNVEATPAWVESFAPTFEGADVLLSEVLEHIDMINAQALLESILATDANQIVLTVPNGAFNVNYGMEPDETRHPDHLWEPSPDYLLNTFLNIPLHGRILACEYVGDDVNGQTPTLLAKFSSKV